jgi:uncharacterized protein DUF3352
VIRRAAIVLAAFAALLVAGCGGGGGGSSDELASLAPADAPFYMESVVRPEGSQRDAIDSLSSRVGGIDDPGSAIVQQLDLSLSNSGIEATYEDDIAPWLGERAAVFVQSFQSDAPFAAMLESTDTGAAEDFLNKAASASPGADATSYKGVDYYEMTDSDGLTTAVGLVGDSLVFGLSDGFKAAVDASQGDSLADSSAFEEGTSSLPDDNLALGYADGSQAGDALASQAADPLQATVVRSALQTLANGPVAFAVSATPDSATVDLSLPTGMAAQLRGGDLVGKAPATAWFAMGAEDLGGILRGALDSADSLPIPSIEDQLNELTGVDPNDVVSWLGDGYGFVGGTSERTINIGGVATSSDPDASAKAIDAFHARFQQDADAKLGPPPQGADEGFTASAPESPQAIQVGQFGDRVVAALGPGQPAEEALDPQQPLADDPTFQDGEDTLGDDSTPLAYVSLPPFFVVAEKGGSASDPDYIAAKPYLQKLDYLMVGTSGDGDRSTARFVVGVE